MLGTSPNQFRMCSVCHNQRPATTLMLLPCCFRQSICLWCVAASVEVRNSVECLRCGGNFHGPFVSNEFSSRMAHINGSLPASPQPYRSQSHRLPSPGAHSMNNGVSASRNNGHHITCHVAGCGRRALNEACFHCGAWLCAVDDFVHREDIADKQINVLRMIIRRARDWQTTFGDGSTNSTIDSTKSPPTTQPNLMSPIVKTMPTPTLGQMKAKPPDSLETVDITPSAQNFAGIKSDELQMVIERSEELCNLLESKRARRLDLRSLASEINDMKKKVSFLEGVQIATRPTNILMPTSLQKANQADQSHLDALIKATSNDLSSVEKLKVAIAIEEERLKERRKTLSPCTYASNSPLPLLLVVSEIGANDVDKKKLFFHRVHGSNIVISSDGSQASRKDVTHTTGGNICFTNRPVVANERVLITCLQSYPTSHSIEIGFTTHDPYTLTQDLPESFANSSWGRDEQSWLPGFWIYIGRGILSRETETLSFCFNAGGQVIIIEGNGATSTHKLPTSFAPEQPAYALIDLAGRPSLVSIRSSNSSK